MHSRPSLPAVLISRTCSTSATFGHEVTGRSMREPRCKQPGRARVLRQRRCCKSQVGASIYDVWIGGGGGSWKSGCRKGGCVNLILQISSKCEQRRGVKESEKFADVINACSLIKWERFFFFQSTRLAFLRLLVSSSARRRRGNSFNWDEMLFCPIE